MELTNFDGNYPIGWLGMVDKFFKNPNTKPELKVPLDFVY